MPLRMFGWHPRLASLPAEARTSPPARPHIDARRRHRIVRPLKPFEAIAKDASRREAGEGTSGRADTGGLN